MFGIIWEMNFSDPRQSSFLGDSQALHEGKKYSGESFKNGKLVSARPEIGKNPFRASKNFNGSGINSAVTIAAGDLMSISS